MAYTQAELDELRAKYPGVDINAITQASSNTRALDPVPLTPEQQAANARAAALFQSQPNTGGLGLGADGSVQGSHVEIDANGNNVIVSDDGRSRVQEGDHTNTFLGNVADFANNSTLGLFPKGNELVQKVVNTEPIYQTGEFKGPVPTPFGGYGVTVPKAKSTPILNQAIDALPGLAKNLKGALGGGSPADVADPNVAGIIGGSGTSGTGGGTNGANFFQQLAQARSQTPAPQLQRTSIDFSGMGSGQGPASQQPTPAPYPGATVGGGLSSIMGGQGTAPAVAAPPQSGTSSQTAFEKMQRDLYAPPPTSGAPPPPPSGTASGMAGSVFNPSGGQVTSTYGGGGGGGGGSAPQTGTYGPQQTPAPAMRAQAPAGQPIGPTSMTQPPAPAPAPAPTGGIPSTGQFANPLFAQSQQTRDAEGQVMGGIMSPDMYATPQRGSADASRNVQGQVLAATTDPNIYRNPAERDQAQTRQQQQGLVSLLGRDLNGGQPSLAELQMRQGTDESIAAANALAASAGPGNANAMARQAADIAAKTRQGLVSQTAALRAQEYAKAREEAGQVTATGRAQDISNQGQQYQNVTNLSQLAASQARDLRGQDLQDLGMSYKNATDKAGLASNLAVQSRAQDLQALGMSYDNAVKQAQLEVEQNKAQLGADLTSRQIASSEELGLLGLGQNATELEVQQKMHLADLLMQQYGIDKNAALQMVGNNPIDRVFKGIATGGAAGGVPGAVVGGLSGLAYNYLS